MRAELPLQPAELSRILESVRTAESIEALRSIVSQHHTKLEEIEEEEPFKGLAYGKLRSLLETGRSYFFYKNLEYISYFATALAVVTMMDLGIQFLLATPRPDGIVVTEALVVVFGALTLIIFGPLGLTSAKECRATFEVATGRSLSRESLGSLEEVAREVGETVNAVLLPPEKSSIKQPLVLNPNEFTAITHALFERNFAGPLFDYFDVTSEGIRVWREKRVGPNPRYLIGPYLITWDRLHEASAAGSAIEIGSMCVEPNALGKLLEYKERTL
jgi:hypothetical protein